MVKVTVLDDEIVETMPVDEQREPLVATAASAVEKRGAPVRRVERIQSCAPGRTELVVSSYDKQIETVELTGEPNAIAAQAELPGGCRPLAVRFELRVGGLACTCLVRSGKGPQRVMLSPPAALALVAGGVHGIVTNAPRRRRKQSRRDSCGEAPEAKI